MINMLLTSLNYARSEAVKRNNTVFVERNLGFSQSWDNGWNDFIDVNDNSEYNAGVDTLLKTYPALTNGFTLRTGPNYGDWVSFLPFGLIVSSSGTNNDLFRLCVTAGDMVNFRGIAICP